MSQDNFNLVHSLLKTCEPQTPNEIAEQANLNQKTVQTILFELAATNKEVKSKLLELYDEIFAHSGYGEIKVEMRILRRGQKEIILHCGKQYRFVVDFISQKSPYKKN